MPIFDYTTCPLPSPKTHIRLLHLRLASPTPDADRTPTSTLECTLLTTPMQSPLPYKALSYTWGTQPPTTLLPISLPSTKTPTSTYLPITPSLHNALLHLATNHEGPSLTLWIDQICINQADNIEKGEQVLLMADVYSRAAQVLIWLGPAEGRSDELMELWGDVGSRAESIGLVGYFTKERIGVLLGVMDGDRGVGGDDEDAVFARKYWELAGDVKESFEALIEVTVEMDERPWFHRVWTVQELALCADTVFICGSKSVSVEHVWLADNIFSAAVKPSLKGDSDTKFQELVLQAQSHRIQPLLSIRRRRQNFANGKGDGDDLFGLLRKLLVESNMGVTQTRDRVYGLLGLAVDGEALNIRPDYTTVDTAPIFTQVARSMISRGRVELLSFSQFPKEDDLGNLPTWVPDWRPNLAPSFYIIFESAEEHLLSASGNTHVSLVPETDPNVLGIRGYLVDTIEEVGNSWHASDDHTSRLLLFETLEKFCTKSTTMNESLYADPTRRAEALWRVPVGDLYWTPDVDYIRARKPLVEDEYHDCARVAEIIANSKDLSPEERQVATQEVASRRFAASRYWNNMRGMDGKRPYITRRGYIGMCPGPTIGGDVVAIFSGARLPYVVRPQPGGERYTFIGEAYCDGMMDGEVLQREQERSFSIQ